MAGVSRAGTAAAFALLIGAWGFNYLFVRAGLGFAPPLWLAAGRSALGCVAIGASLLAVPRLRGGLDRRGQRDAALLGLPNTALFFGLWFVGAQSVLPGTAAVIVYTFPLWVALLSWPVLGHPVGRWTAGSIALGFGGVVLLTEPWQGGAGSLPALAVIELVLGAVSWAIGTVLFQRRFAPVEMQEANAFQLLGGSGALLVASLVFEPTLPGLSAPLIGVWLWLGGIGTGAAYAIWFWLLGRTHAATLSGYVFLVPVVALSASAVLLGERLDLLQLVGVGAVLVSVYGTGRSAPAREEPAA